LLSDFPVFPILLSTDMAASRAFYHDVLGLEVVSETDERILLRSGGGTGLLISHSTVGTSDTQTQVAWRVADIHASIADLRARGVKIEDYEPPAPQTIDGVADMGHSWDAWFIDPSGNVLSIIEPKG